MSQSILDSVLSYVGPSVIEKLVANLGDEPQQISDTVTAGIPVLLNGILQKSGTTAGLGSILHAAKEANDDNVLDNIGDLIAGSGSLTHKAGSFIQSLFGDQESHVMQGIADATGAKKSSVGSILRLLGPIILAWLGKQVISNKMDNKGFASHLSGLLPSLATLLPAFLSWDKLGLKKPDALKHSLEAVQYTLSGDAGPHTVPVTPHMAEEKKSGMGWLLPLLLGLATIAALWYFLGRGGAETEVVAPVVAEVEVPAPTPVVLPGGVQLPLSKGTMESKLLEFMNDASRPAGEDVWFDFDDVNFDLGSAVITKESDIQLSNIAKIFAAFPTMKAKVGGYTDRSGDSLANLTLSQQRADAVFAELKRLGVADSQLVGAEGYGSQFATLPADATEEARRVDRRMALSVRGK